MSGCTVLVVDDDLDVLDTLCDLLLEAGYAVVCVTNGREALNRIHGDVRPDVILLDLMMPVMNGWEFLAAQRAEPAIADVPVIVMTAHSRPRDVHAQAIMEKPVRLDVLLGELARACPNA